LDAGGLLLKHIFGDFYLDDSETPPKARENGNYAKL